MMEDRFPILKFQEQNVIHLNLVEYLSNKKIALSQDILAIVDGSNSKKVLFFDVTNGKQMTY